MSELAEEVFAAVAAQFPGYPLTKPVIRATILATLAAISEPTAAMFAASRTADPDMMMGAVGRIVASTVWREMLQALVAEIVAEEPA